MGWLSLLLVVLLVAPALTALFAFRPWAGRSAERILADRFAHGEIDADEYRQRLATLRSAAS
ncbi:SHOCT domain-containing protein [Actinoplanes philippinensis]|uniref:SHOCT domain-containing protein n=1 Tax=Actinoplanes philippinensis TaxID=35752 RepID=UPI0033D6695D